jgi:hypothetical protein
MPPDPSRTHRAAALGLRLVAALVGADMVVAAGAALGGTIRLLTLVAALVLGAAWLATLLRAARDVAAGRNLSQAALFLVCYGVVGVAILTLMFGRSGATPADGLVPAVAAHGAVLALAGALVARAL